MNTTPITPKTHPAGTRFIADGGSTVGLYELLVVEWSKEGNVKMHFPSGTEGWLARNKLPASVEILVHGKPEEIKLEELQENFSKLLERIKNAGSGVINEVCDATNEFFSDLAGHEKPAKKEEKKAESKKN